MSQRASGPTEPPPFSAFADPAPGTVLRDAVTAACRRSEAACVTDLLAAIASAPDAETRTAALARRLVESLRRRARTGGVEGLIQEYAFSTQEGVALMCLAEALLRIPDDATRDALIRDTIGPGDWRAHLGHSPSLFVNAATWGLIVTGRLIARPSETGLSAALARLIGRGGEPLIRRGVDLAVRTLGERFVTGRTIAEALANGRRLEAAGFSHSYDILGEAAMTAADAARYRAAYADAIRAIGAVSAGRGPQAGPGISIKLSALHPRYVPAQRGRVMAELLPVLKGLAALAREHEIGLNIDAEEADRLELSLDLLEALALDPDLSGWDGLGFVVQAYGRRCPFVIDWLVDLARRSRHRLMVRLVKGAYWDSEIKRAQVDGLSDFPVFTRKLHTDVSYLACAGKLLAAPDAVFPQFATHNAQTVAAIVTLAGPDAPRGTYEFQCLHGMGEPLYETVIGSLGRPCRIYAPVGTHETLLAYLVRRLLENGANASFVNRVADPAVPVEDLIADPVAQARAMPVVGAPHPRIRPPRALYGAARVNSAGLDLSDAHALARLGVALAAGADTPWTARPTDDPDGEPAEPVRNPADRRDVVGHVRPAGPSAIAAAVSAAAGAAASWGGVPVAARAGCLARAADALEARMPVLIGLIVREAGKSTAGAVAELREAVDFLRYYAAEAVRTLSADAPAPLGTVVCISPWNFPLAIFTGQVGAALAAGNTVLAKPAEETPLVAAEMVRLLHEAGIPRDALRFVPGDGSVGAALVADPRIAAVMFTGSGAAARSIQRRLAGRLTAQGQPIPLVAETGGQNAMVVDSSALPEQVVADVLASAFDSAGQRCSALRLLCLQEEIADPVLAMLRGAMRELAIGNPDRLSVDVGPVITAQARDDVLAHVAEMRAGGHRVTALPLPAGTRHGSFVAPTLIEIDRVADVGREVFGPVLHVLRYARAGLDALLDAIDATGYGLTFGLHTRLDETVARVTGRIAAGNVYVNRNLIGAVVGVQPFGGSGLSGTGPKAGGPLILGRLLARTPPGALDGLARTAPVLGAARAYAGWLDAQGHRAAARQARDALARTPLGLRAELPGPVGETNRYALRPRGRIAALAATEDGLRIQIGAILATGNRAVVERAGPAARVLDGLPAAVAAEIAVVADWRAADPLAGFLFEGPAEALRALTRQVAGRDGPILSVQAARSDGGYDLIRLIEETAVSTNVAAAGGNASLLAIG